LLAGLDTGDAGGHVAAAWIAAQYLRLLCRAPDRTRAEELLYRLLMHCADAHVLELTRLARTLDAWRAEILAAFDHPGISNGPTEAINGRLEHLRGTALGFRNLANYIARALLDTGGFRPRLHPLLR